MITVTMRVGLLAMLVWVCSSVAFADLPAFDPPAADEMRAHYIDVGQGAAVLLEFSCAAALIDTGGEKNPQFNSDERLSQYLTSFFMRRPDLSKTIRLLILTHAHVDHTGGVKTIFKNYGVKFLVDNGLENKDQKFAHGKARGIAAKTKWQAITERAIVSPEGMTSAVIDPIACPGTDPLFRVLWGALGEEDWDHAIFADPNASSVVTRVDFGAASFLFPGDLEDSVHAELIDFYSQNCVPGNPGSCSLDVDVYHAAHHGSHNGTNLNLMRAMTPKIAVVSVGDKDRQFPRTSWNHGHPRIDAMNALTDAAAGVSLTRPNVIAFVANRGSSSKSINTPQFSELSLDHAVYATSWDGTVVVTAKADGTLKVETEQ